MSKRAKENVERNVLAPGQSRETWQRDSIDITLILRRSRFIFNNYLLVDVKQKRKEIIAGKAKER